jgi:ADP-heptose:LPS heptosyltransferase
MNNTYTATSLNEVFSIVKKYERISLQIILNLIVIKLQITLFNLVLDTLRFLLFDTQIPRERKIKNIVVYSVGILGDNIVRLPAIIALKKRYPTAKLTVINKYQIWSPKPATELFSNSPFVDRFISIQNNPVTRQGLKFLYNPNILGNLECDLFVNLSPLGNRGWFGGVLRELILAKKIGAKYAVGFEMTTILKDSALNTIKHRFIKNTPRLPETILEKLNLPIDYKVNVFPIKNESAESVKSNLKESGITSNFAVLHPGSKLDCKNWPADKFASVALYLDKKYGIKSIITGVQSEEVIAQEICALAQGSALNFTGKTTLNETIELVRLAKIIISNDTGIMHLASILNNLTIGIFGTRLSPTIWWPLGTQFTGIFAFSKSSLRYNDEPDNSDLLLIKFEDITSIIDDKIANSYDH